MAINYTRPAELFPTRGRKSRQSRRLRLSRPERPNIEASRIERSVLRRIVDVWRVRQQGDGAECVERRGGEGVLWPLRDQPDLRKSLRRREGRARIDDRDIKAGHGAHRRQSLSDM